MQKIGISRAAPLIASLLCLLMAACSEQTSQGPPENAERALPAGFLDAAPPPPTSDTLVLSGGNLVLAAVTNDTAIVLRDGKVLTWGKRGEVDMPNDSVGRDMRGKWITPGTVADLNASRLPIPAALEPGAPANLLVFNTGPDLSAATGEDLYGVIAAGELEIFDAASK